MTHAQCCNFIKALARLRARNANWKTCCRRAREDGRASSKARSLPLVAPSEPVSPSLQPTWTCCPAIFILPLTGQNANVRDPSPLGLGTQTDRPSSPPPRLKEPWKKYKRFPPLNLPERQWPSKTVDKAPRWLATDLRDGNQSLVDPMASCARPRLAAALTRSRTTERQREMALLQDACRTWL